jgi:CRP-like cAMP-binding protein
MDDHLQRYRDFPLFRKLDDDEIAGFVDACEEFEYGAGETFIRQGEQGKRIFFIVVGEMDVLYLDDESDEHQLALITAPAVVGEMEFLTRESRTASVRARSAVSGLSLAFERMFDQLQAGDPATVRVFFHITQVLARRLEAMDRKFAELNQQSPGARFDEMRAFQQKLMTEWTV